MGTISTTYGDDVVILPERWHAEGMILHRPDPIVRRLEQLGFARHAATQLSQQGAVLDLSPGVVLCRAGERGTQAFVLVGGNAEVQTSDGVFEVGAGDVVGELATLDPHRLRNATVTTTTPVRLLVFDVATFRVLADQADLRERLAPDRLAA